MCNSHFRERTTCPCCGSATRNVLIELPFSEDPIRQYLREFYGKQGGVEFEYLHGATFAVAKCGECSLLYQTQIGTDGLLARLYNHWIDPSLARQRDEQRRKLGFYLGCVEEVVTVMNQIGKRPADCRLLDFGMGWAGWCQTALGLGCRVFGHELANERIDFARSRGIHVVAWDEIPDQRFDFINTEQVFEHLSEPRETLRHLVKSLEPTGLLKISVPDGTNVPHLLRTPDWTEPKDSPRSLNPIAPLEHINCFNRAALLRLATDAGLEPVGLDWQTRIIVQRRSPDQSHFRSALREAKRLLFPAMRRRKPVPKPPLCQFFRRRRAEMLKN